MKIGIIIGSLGIGGAERVSIRLTEWWLQKGYQVSFYTTMTPSEKEYTLPDGACRYFCHGSGAGFGLIKVLRIKIKEDAPDAVIIMDTPMCVYAVPALLGLRIPFLVSERSAPNNAAIRRTTKFLSHILMGFAQAYVFQTNGAMRCYRAGIRKKGVVIPNPLVLENLPEPYEGQRQRKIVAVGRLVSAKNYPLLITAFSKFVKSHKEYVLEIYGDGVLKDRITALAKESSAAESIFLMGAHRDVLDKIRNAAVFVLSSDLEGMPNALAEAMAIGVPSVSTDCPSGGPADLITNGIDGLLVPIGDASALCAAMTAAADNEVLQRRLSQNGVQLRQRLDINKIGAQWVAIIQKIIG